MNCLEFKDWLQNFDTRTSSPLVMGIVNVTPDSFFANSRYQTISAVLKVVEKMIMDGVDIIDIGGESTRPGAVRIDEETELLRVIPVIKALRDQFDVCLSIDTYKPRVMEAAIEVGANIINDVTGLADDESIDIAKQYNVPVCMMHITGTLDDMSKPFQNQDEIVKNILHFFHQRLTVLEQQNFPIKNLILDPGIGFGKSGIDNLRIIQDIQNLCALGLPVLLGVSRKKFIGEILEKPNEERLFGSLAAQVLGFYNGCRIFRTHDVASTRDGLKISEAIQKSQKGLI